MALIRFVMEQINPGDSPITRFFGRRKELKILTLRLFGIILK